MTRANPAALFLVEMEDPFDEDTMNALLIHDLAAAIERDAEDLATTDHDAPFTGSWSRREAPPTHPDEHLERVLEQLRLGPPSLRRG